MKTTNYHSDHSSKLAQIDRTWSSIRNSFQFIKQQGYDLSSPDEILSILSPFRTDLKNFVNSKKAQNDEDNS
jgi:hypothetical protein